MRDLHAQFVSGFLFPTSQRLRGGNYRQKLAEARANLSLSRDEISNLQFQKLRRMIQHASLHVPYYRQLFKQLGLEPQDIREWSDFEDLPVLTKSQVREFNPLFQSEKRRSPIRKFTTGGSTGTPLHVQTGEISIAAEHACRTRAFDRWGIKIGDRLVQIWGNTYSLDHSLKTRLNRRIYKPLKDVLFNRREMPAITYGEEDLERQWRYLNRFKPVYIRGFPSALFLLAQYITANNFDGRSLDLKLIITGSEILYDWQQSELEQVFGCRIMNSYGSFEIGYAACSYPCGALHTNDDFVIVEVIKPNPKDQFGQIVATRLDNWEFPLIRYNVEDLAVGLGEHHNCSLGISLLKLDQIIGRNFDLVRLADRRIVHGGYFDNLIRKAPGVIHFQVVQKSPDKFDIFLVVDPDRYTPEGVTYISQNIQSFCGPVQVNIIKVDSIPAEASGKFRYVRSEVRSQDL